MRIIILSKFLYACASWTLTAALETKNPSPWDEMPQETSEYFLQRPRDERGGLKQNSEYNLSLWWSPNRGEETETQMV